MTNKKRVDTTNNKIMGHYKQVFTGDATLT